MNEVNGNTMEEVYEAGFDLWCEVQDLHRGLNEATEDISPNMKKLLIFLVTPYIFCKAVKVFFISLFRHGLDAFGMTRLFMKYERKYLEERGWIETDFIEYEGEIEDDE